VQQRLVSIGLGLRHVQHEWAAGRPGDAAGALDEAVVEIATTIAELRELAHGIRPSCLEEGLERALTDLADRTRLPVTVEACGQRFPPEVETAAYFTACEGLANALKHARASAVRLAANHVDGRLVVSVADDGVGGARIRRGTGLAGLADRVAAHGGTLTLDSAVGAGTRLVAEFPCAS
jgi:signal transduction histidine kinase